MSPLTSRLRDELQRLAGTAQPTTITLAGDNGIVLSIDQNAVESLSSSVAILRLSSPALQNAGWETLQRIAQAICDRVTYLMDDIGTVEIDVNLQQVLVRSSSPTEVGDRTEFYEVLLKTDGGAISLERFAWSRGQIGRTAVPLNLTHEILLRLVGDLENIVTSALAP